MWPCLSSDRNGALVGGSVVYDQTLDQYNIQVHFKPGVDGAWSTLEADNGPFNAAGPSLPFRIGFGDYFDCDRTPDSGPAVMAWSEGAKRQQPWQTWARVVDACLPLQVKVSTIEAEIFQLTEILNNPFAPIALRAYAKRVLPILKSELPTLQAQLNPCRAQNA
jgi:hypothetical protein